MKTIAVLCVLGAGIFWGSSGVFVNLFGALGLESMDLVAMRSVLAALTTFVFIMIRDRKLLRFKLRDAWIFLGSGSVGLFMFSLCYFTAIKATSMSVAAVLLYTSPAIVLVASRFVFGERFTKAKAAAVLLIMSGNVLVTGLAGGSVSLSVTGVLFGLGAGFCYATSSIFGKISARHGYDALTLTFWQFAVAAVLSLLFADIGNIVSVATATPANAGLALVYGCFMTLAPHLLFNTGLKYLESSRASMLSSVELISASVLGVIFLDEAITLTTVAGIVLVLGGVALSVERSKKPAKAAGDGGNAG